MKADTQCKLSVTPDNKVLVYDIGTEIANYIEKDDSFSSDLFEFNFKDVDTSLVVQTTKGNFIRYSRSDYRLDAFIEGVWKDISFTVAGNETSFNDIAVYKNFVVIGTGDGLFIFDEDDLLGL